MKRFAAKTVGVLMGGISSEREVSLKSGQACADALKRLGYRVCTLDADAHIAEALRRERVDVAFIALHGRLGEDGAIQGLLSVMRIPHTGSGVLASALGMDKMAARQIFLHHQIPVPPFIAITKGAEIPLLPFDYPVVVKPNAEGSSIGVTLVQTPDALPAAVASAFSCGPKILIEKYIAGREVQVGILNDCALGVIEIRPKPAFYDYNAKYVAGMSEHLFPAPLPDPVYRAMMDVGLRTHRALECRGATRVDLRLSDDMQPYVLEINTLPGMTETSLLPEMARGAGLDFETLVEQILDAAALDG